MNYILFLIVLNSSGHGINSSNAVFSSEINCMQAISKLIDMEKKFGVRVQATCVKQ
jgi:hypothetical protein